MIDKGVFAVSLDQIPDTCVWEFAQEVRVEKEGIERRIDDLAQDAAG